MELTFLTLVLILIILALLLLIGAKIRPRPVSRNLPPGSFGWPLLGESLEYLRANRDGLADKFVRDRVERYKSNVFKTSMFGQPMAFLCGPAGNKFLFSNEGKKVAVWWLPQSRRLFGPSLLFLTSDESRIRRKLLMAGFFNTESLKNRVPAMDEVTRRYIETHWQGKEDVRVLPSVKLYTFEIACRLLMGVTEPDLTLRLLDQFNIFTKGLGELPLNIPGTRFHRATIAVDALRAELRAIMRQRRVELEQRPSPAQDLLSHLLVNADENGKLMTESDIVNDMLTLLFAGYDTSSSAICMLMKYIREQPRVYENVLREQMKIAASKVPGELLKWEDLQKMKYSWNVISEVLRIAPPSDGTWREALTDITFEGYTIPKGWKLHWSAAYTHKDPSCYRNAMEFDESRFEGTGPPPFSYVPFGGGPRMCLGKEFAHFGILVFLHNLINRFDWDLMNPDEKLSYDPLLIPVNGLPVRLRARELSV